MKIVTLKGISQHGKNRIREQGDQWTVLPGQLESVHSFKHSGRQGPFVMLVAVNDKSNVRWVSLTDDPDFEIVRD